MPKIQTNAAGTTRDKILQAALTVFLEVGYERANLDKVAALAGVTKPTVYSHFGSKIGLLQAVAEQQTQAQVPANLQATDDVRRDLTEFAGSFLSSTLHPDAIRLHRFAIVEAMTHPELVAPLLNAGPQTLNTALRDYLDAQTKAGRLCCKNTSLAAQQLLGLLAGIDLLSIILTQQLPSKAELKKRITSAIDVFLSFYATRGGQS